MLLAADDEEMREPLNNNHHQGKNCVSAIDHHPSATRRSDGESDATNGSSSSQKVTAHPLWSLQWLPLVGDKVRNNVRNRFTLMAAYANATALVLIVLLLLLYNPEVRPSSLKFVVPPPTTVQLGAAAAQFSARYTDGDGNPVRGETLYVSFAKISQFTRTVRLTTEETATSRTVDCVETMLFGASPFREEDIGLCAPQIDPILMTNTTAVTNEEGIGLFSDVVLAHGVSKAAYLVLVGVRGTDTNLITYAFTTAYGPIEKLVQTKSVNIPGGGLTFRAKQHQFVFEAEFRTSNSAPPRQATAQLLAGNFLSPQGIRGERASSAIPGGKTKSIEDRISFVNLSNYATTIVFDNITAEESDGGNLTSSSSSSPLLSPTSSESLWRARFFFNVTVFGANNDNMYIVVFFWGISIPILTLPTQNSAMYPQLMYFPIPLAPPLIVVTEGTTTTSTGDSITSQYPRVESLTLFRRSDYSQNTPAIPLTTDDTVIEGEELILHLQLSTESNTPETLSLPYFLSLEPSREIPTPLNNFEVEGSPYTWQKVINSKALGDFHRLPPKTNASGGEILVFSMSFSGNVGLYDLTIACDGRDLPWSSVPSHESYNGRNLLDDRLPLRLQVKSALSKWSVATTQAPWGDDFVTVGSPWIRTPFIQVFRQNHTTGENMTFPGKRMRVKPQLSSDQIGVEFTSQDANSQGIINPVSIAVVYAASEGKYLFDLYVDDIVVGTIEKTVKWPVVTDDGSPLPDYVVPTFTNASRRLWTGVPFVVDWIIRDYKANPVPNASTEIQINFGTVIDPTYSVPTGADGRGISADHRVNGYSTFYAMPITLRTKNKSRKDGGSRFQTQLIFPVFPRYKRVVGFGYYDDYPRRFNVSFDAEWSQVSQEYPLEVRVTQALAPRYVRNFFQGADPGITYTGPAGATLANETLVFEANTFPKPPEGLYVLSIIVDGASFNINPVGSVRPSRLKLSIHRSLYTSGNILPLEYSKPFPAPPQVRVSQEENDDESGGVDDVIGTQLVAQLGARLSVSASASASSSATSAAADATDSPPPFQWIWPAENDIRYGGSLAWEKAVVTSTDLTGGGVATFTDWAIDGLAEGLDYKIRYCTGIDIQHFNSSSNAYEEEISTNCVEEDFIFNTSWFSKQPNMIFAQPETITVAPGSSIPPLNVSLLDGNGQPTSGSLLFKPEITAVQFSAGASINCYYFGQAYYYPPTGMPVPGSHVFPSACAIGANTPAGAYKLYVVGAGAKSNAILVTVTDQVASLDLKIGEFPDASNFSLGYTIPVTVDAATLTGDPTPNKAVELAVAKLGYCEGVGCGTLSSSSRRAAITDDRGRAILPLTFSAGSSGVFKLIATVASKLSTVALRQDITRGLVKVGHKYGALKSTLPQLVPSLEFEARVLLKLTEAPLSANAATQSVADTLQGITDLNTLLGSSSAQDRLISAAQESSQAIESIRSTSATFVLQNPVHKIKILEQNPVSFTITVPATEAVAISQEYTLGTNVLKLQALDVEGNPVPYSKITYSTSNNALCSIGFSSAGSIKLDTNEQGIVTLEGAIVKFTGSGAFDLIVSGQGGGLQKIPQFLTFTVARVETGELMQVMAFGLVLVYSPLLLASVPHSRIGYSIVSVLVTLTVTIFLFLGFFQSIASSQSRNFMITYYFYFALGTCVIVAISNIGGLGLELLGHLKWRRLRFMNDEAKAVNIVKYVLWITNARLEKQIRESEEEEEVKARTKALKKQSKQQLLLLEQERKEIDDGPRKDLKRTEYVSKKGKKLLKSVKSKIGKSNSVKMEDVERPALEIPSDVNPAATIPLNYLIAISMSVVLAVALTFIMWWILIKIHEFFATLLNFLPNPDSAASIQQANELLFEGLNVVLPEIVRKYPQFSFLSTLLLPLQEMNVVGLLIQIREFIAAFQLRVDVCFPIGMVVGLIVVVVTVVLTTINVRKLIIAARRGEIPNAAQLEVEPIEGYIGLHCFHFIIAHQLVAWIIIIITLLLSVGLVRSYLWTQLGVIIVGSIGSFIVEFIVNKVLVGWFLTDGELMVIRPEGYAIWHFVGLILGAFTGLVKSIARWFIGIGAFSALFARLDVSIFPQPLISKDEAHMGFLSVVVTEARSSNPIFLTFASILLSEWKLKHLAKTGRSPEQKQAVITRGEEGDGDDGGDDDGDDVNTLNFRGSSVECDTLLVNTPSSSSGGCCHTSQGRFSLSTSVLNIARVLARRNANSENALEPWIEPVEPFLSLERYSTSSNVVAGAENSYSRKEKVRNRFWLWWILHKNPSLRKYRKHVLLRKKLLREGSVQLFILEEEDDDEKEGQTSSAEDQTSSSKVLPSSRTKDDDNIL